MTDEELKAVTFSEEDTKEIGGFIHEGVHSVTITKVEFKKNANDKIYLNVDVKNDNGETGSAKVWFVGAATPYSINTIRRIFVHNAETKEDKDKIRGFFKDLGSLYVLSTLVEKLIGKQCWYTVQKTDETYEDKDGNEKFRYDKNIWGYEPTLKEKDGSSSEVVPTDIEGEVIDLSEIPF